MPEPVKVFYSYAHKDETLRDELAKHLSPLQRRGLLHAWHDRRIPHGSEWDPEIKQHLEAAQIILLLISPDFLASDYCHLETTLALERHAAGQARVIPVYLRPAAWEDATFAKLQGLPRDARPVTAWDNPDQAFKDIAQAIRTVAQAVYRTPAGGTIAYTDLAQPHHWSWRWRSVVAVLVMAAALGWYGYSPHTTRLAPHLAVGKQLLATGQYDLARQAYQRALAQSWFGTREGQLGLERSSIFNSADGAYHPEVVQQRIEHLRQQYPNDPYADLFEGDLYAVQEQPDDYAKAQTLYERAVARDPTLAHGYFSLGVVYDKLGRPQQALAMYNQAVRLVPWYQPYLHNLAYQYVRLQDYDRAIAAYNKAQAVDDTFVLTHLELAQVYRQLGQLESAQHAQQHAVALLDDPQVAGQSKNQQPWYFSQGAQHLPLDTLARKQCYAWWSLAVTLRLLGRTAEAEQYQRKSCGVSAEEEAYIREWAEAESGMQR